MLKAKVMELIFVERLNLSLHVQILYFSSYCCRQENPNSTRRLKSVHDQHVPRWRQNTAQSHQGRYSPALSVQFLPAPDCILLPLSPAAASASESEQHPLKKELEALIELVNSVRIDLLQTSMLVIYISDYIKNWNKVNTYARYI